MTVIGDSVQLKELQSEEYDLIQSDDDLRYVSSHVDEAFIESDVLFFSGDFLTGAVVKHGDGEYEEVWLSTDPEPWLLTSYYKRCI